MLKINNKEVPISKSAPRVLNRFSILVLTGILMTGAELTVTAKTWQQQVTLADSLFEVHATDSAIVVAKAALDSVKSDRESNFIDLVTILRRIGYYQENADLLKEAESSYLRALELTEEALGSYDLEVANDLYRIAFVIFKRGRYDEAKPLFHRSMVIRERVLPKDHPDLALSLYGLANVNLYMGDFSKAFTLGQEALSIS